MGVDSVALMAVWGQDAATRSRESLTRSHARRFLTRLERKGEERVAFPRYSYMRVEFFD